MRVILVVVLCLSSGFWTNGSEQDNSTEQSSTNGDLNLDSTTLKSITDKGTTVGTANALQNGKTELLSRHLSDLISALKSSTPRVLVGNPAKSTTQTMLGAKSTPTSRSTQIESSTSSTNADKSTENPKLSTLDLLPTTHIMTSTSTPIVGNVNSATQTALGATFTPGSTTPQIQSSTLGAMPGNVAESTNETILGALSMPDSSTTQIQRPKLRIELPIGSNVATQSTTQTTSGATFTPGSSTRKVQSSSDGASVGETTESPKPTTLDISKIAGGGDYAENTAPIMSAALSMPDSNKSSKLMSEESPEPTTLDPSTIVGDPAESTAPIMSAALSMPDSNKSSKLMSEESPEPTTLDPSTIVGDPAESTAPIMSAALSMPDSNKSSKLMSEESPEPTTLDPSTIVGDPAESTAPIMSAALSMPDSNKSSKLMSEESPEPTTLDPSTIVGDPAESTAPIMSAALSMPDSNQSSKLMSEESPKLTTIDPSRTIQIKKSNYGPIGDHTESTTPTMSAALSMPDSNQSSKLMSEESPKLTTIDPSRTIQIKKSNYGPIGDHTESTTPTMSAALSMPDSDSNKNSGLMPRNVAESTTQNIAGTENTSDSPITNEMNTDLTTTYMAEELTTKYSTTNKKEETSSTGPSQSPTPTPEPMTTTIACSNPYAPVLYFDNYEIIWNIKPKQDCDIDSVNLTCVTKDDEYSRTFDSTVNSLNVLDEKITQGKVYSCEAFLNATNGATSEKSNTLQLPPGTQRKYRSHFAARLRSFKHFHV
uniref:Flocculation protein FLO11-like isoform X1 n=1 Tax=Diabrotica virgifera virgifera TaxID=50390 RepID=A0A6P7GHL5_DIAVI